VEDRVQEQLHQKAREEWRSELSQLQERIGFLGDLEKVLTAELERLSKETAAGPRSVEERLRDLENEVRRLKMALDKK